MAVTLTKDEQLLLYKVEDVAGELLWPDELTCNEDGLSTAGTIAVSAGDEFNGRVTEPAGTIADMLKNNTGPAATHFTKFWQARPEKHGGDLANAFYKVGSAMSAIAQIVESYKRFVVAQLDTLHGKTSGVRAWWDDDEHVKQTASVILTELGHTQQLIQGYGTILAAARSTVDQVTSEANASAKQLQ